MADYFKDYTLPPRTWDQTQKVLDDANAPEDVHRLAFSEWAEANRNYGKRLGIFSDGEKNDSEQRFDSFVETQQLKLGMRDPVMEDVRKGYITTEEAFPNLDKANPIMRELVKGAAEGEPFAESYLQLIRNVSDTGDAFKFQLDKLTLPQEGGRSQGRGKPFISFEEAKERRAKAMKEIEDGLIRTRLVKSEYDRFFKGLNDEFHEKAVNGIAAQVPNLMAYVGIGMATGGIGTAALISGSQGYAQTNADATFNYLQNGDDFETASKKAFGPSVLSGAIEAALTLTFGKIGSTGAEDIFGIIAKQGVNKSANKLLRVAKGLGLEMTEEESIFALQSIVEKNSYNPNLTWADYTNDFVLRQTISGVLAGPTSVLSAFNPTPGEIKREKELNNVLDKKVESRNKSKTEESERVTAFDVVEESREVAEQSRSADYEKLPPEGKIENITEVEADYLARHVLSIAKASDSVETSLQKVKRMYETKEGKAVLDYVLNNRDKLDAINDQLKDQGAKYPAKFSISSDLKNPALTVKVSETESARIDFKESGKVKSQNIYNTKTGEVVGNFKDAKDFVSGKGGPGAAEAQAEFTRKKTFLNRLVNDPDVPQAAKDVIDPERDLVYKPVSNKATHAEALEAVVAAPSYSNITRQVLDTGSKMQGGIRTFMGMLAVKRMSNEYDQAVAEGNAVKADIIAQDIADFNFDFDEMVRTFGQDIQALASFSYIGKDLSLRVMQKMFKDGAEKDFNSKTASEREAIVDEINEALLQGDVESPSLEFRIQEIEQKLAEAEARAEAAEAKVLISDDALDFFKRMSDRLKPAADAARQRIKSKLGRLNSGVDPTLLADYSIIGAQVLSEVIYDKGKWTQRMVNEFGDSIKPFLDRIFKSSEEYLENEQTSVSRKGSLTSRLKKEIETLKARAGDIEAVRKAREKKPRTKEESPEIQELRKQLSDLRKAENELIKSDEAPKKAKAALKKRLQKRFRSVSKDFHSKFADILLKAAEGGVLRESDIREAYTQAVSTDVQLQKTLFNVAEKASKLDKNSQEYLDLEVELSDKLTRTMGVKLGDLFSQVWFNSVLSGLGTQAINVVGTQSNMITYVVPFMIDNLFNPSGLKRMFSIKNFHEAAQQASRDFQAEWGGRKTFRSGGEKLIVRPDALKTISEMADDTFGGKLLKTLALLRYAAYSLSASDAFNRRLMYEMVIHARYDIHANVTPERMAEITSEAEQYVDLGGSYKSEGEKKRRVATRIYETLRAEVPPKVLVEANRLAAVSTYTQKPEGTMGYVSDALQGLGRNLKIAGYDWFRYGVVPFTNIIGNVTNSSVGLAGYDVVRGIAGGSLADLRFNKEALNAVKKGDVLSVMQLFEQVDGKGLTSSERRVRAIRGVVGATTATLIGLKAIQDAEDDVEDPLFEFTAMGPKDAGKRAQWRQAGGEPYTVRINGGPPVKFTDGPWAVPFMVVGRLSDEARYERKKDRNLSENMVFLIATAAHAVSQSGYINSLVDFGGLFTGEEWSTDASVTSVALRPAQGLVVPAGLMRDLDTLLDSHMYSNKDRSMLAYILSGVPGVDRVATRPMINVFGEPMEVPLEGRIPGVRRLISIKDTEPEFTWMAENDIWVGKLTKDILVAGEKRLEKVGDADWAARMISNGFTREELYDIEKIAGPRIKAEIQRKMKQYPNPTQDQRKYLEKTIKKKVNAIRRDAKDEFIRNKINTIK